MGLRFMVFARSWRWHYHHGLFQGQAANLILAVVLPVMLLQLQSWPHISFLCLKPCRSNWTGSTWSCAKTLPVSVIVPSRLASENKRFEAANRDLADNAIRVTK